MLDNIQNIQYMFIIKIKKVEVKNYYESLTDCSIKALRMLYSMCKNNYKIILTQ